MPPRRRSGPPLLFRAAPATVRVPATSANLGPGFDAAGLALALHDHVVLRATDSGLAIDVAGEGADTVPRTEKHLVVRAARAAFDRLGGQPAGLELVCANRIPHGRGLGSSSAAIVAGVLAARALVTGGDRMLDDEAVLALASEIEGHPDNVAACLLGGVTLAWTDDPPADGGVGAVHAVRLDPHPRLAPVVVIATTTASTAKVRGLLPATVPHADAAVNAGRAALLSIALTTRPDLLLAATADRLHQPYRRPAMKKSAALVDRLRAAGVPAAISGAGPTVIALTTDGVLPPGVRADQLGVVQALPVDTEGAVVVS